MNYLLDTQILLWAIQNHPKLSKKARGIILDPDNIFYFSSASIWEVAIKYGKGHFEGLIEPTEFYRLLKRAEYRELLISSYHAIAVKDLPSIHKDPFDRLLIAQSNVENLILMTVDKHIIKYDVKFLEV